MSRPSTAQQQQQSQATDLGFEVDPELRKRIEELSKSVRELNERIRRAREDFEQVRKRIESMLRR